MNLGDKFNHRLTIRLNDKQFEFLLNVSGVLGVSPSDYIRMCLNAGMVTVDKGLLEKVGTQFEDVKTDIDNQL